MILIDPFLFIDFKKSEGTRRRDIHDRNIGDTNDALCFVRFVVDRIPTPVLEENIKTIRQGGVDCERNFLRALLELYQDMPLPIPNKELNDMDKLPLTRWLNKSGHPMPGHPELPVETATGSASPIQSGAARAYQAGYKPNSPAK